MNGMIYIVNDENLIVRKFECDYDSAISNYYGKTTPEGRYHILPKGFDPPYKDVKLTLFNKKRFTKED